MAREHTYKKEEYRMTTIKEIQKELEERGYATQISDVIKNGVHLTGITIRNNPDQKIAPCFYITEDLEKLSTSEAIDIIEHRLASTDSLDLGDVDQLVSRDSILSKVVIGVQRTSSQDLIKRPTNLDGIEQYLFIRGVSGEDTNWSIKLNPSILRNADLTEAEVWSAAENNTFCDSEITIDSMQEILARMIGMNDAIPEPDMPMYVISNALRMSGAVQIFNHAAVRKWAGKHGFKKLVMLPSSTHEVIVIPADDFDSRLEEMTQMVQEVNATQVDPVEQLSDRAYIIDLAA